jgi:hypothetical protein
MSISLIQQVQQFLRYPELKKISPNTGDATTDNGMHQHLFSQAAIPAVLTALYKYVQTDAGAEDVLRGNNSTDWVGKIFHGKYSSAKEKIKTYSDTAAEHTTSKMNEIAVTANRIMKNNIPEHATIKDVKSFFLNQRNDILLYLPPELNLGELLNDDTIDDNVNKMEGPVSSLMKSIGSAFSNPVTGEDVNRF